MGIELAADIEAFALSVDTVMILHRSDATAVAQ